MAVAATLLTSGASTATAGTPTATTASVSPSPYRLQLLVLHYSRGSSASPSPPSSIVGNGLTWVLLATSNYDVAGVGRRSFYVYRAMAAAPTAGTCVITHGFSHADAQITWQWVEFSGVDPTGSNGAGAVVQAVVGSNGTDDAPSATLAAFGSANNATFGAAGWVALSSSPATAGSGFTLLETRDRFVTQQIGTAVEWRADNDTTVDFALFATSGAGGRAAIGVEIKAATIKTIAGTAGPEIDATALLTVTNPGIPLGQMTATIDIAATAIVSARRPNYRRPRREILWVSGYNGEQLFAIS